MFQQIREKRQTKKLKDILQERIRKAERLYKKPGRRILIWNVGGPKNPFDLQKIELSGVKNAVRKGVTNVAPNTIYQIAAEIGLKMFETYFAKTYSASLSGKRDAASALSHSLIATGSITYKHKNEVARMRHSVQATIYAVADYIETEGLSLDAIRRNDIEPSKQARINSFIDARHKWRTSYRSMAIALTLLVEENSTIIRRIEQARSLDKSKLASLHRLNAVFVYEVADVVLSFIRTFELQGIPELRRLHEEVMIDVDEGRAQVQSLEAKIEAARASKAMSQEKAMKSLSSLVVSKKALDAAQKQWNSFLRVLNQSESTVSRVFEGAIQNLEILKEEARLRLTIEKTSYMTEALRDNFAAVGEIIHDIDRLEVAPLTDADIRILFNMEQGEIEPESDVRPLEPPRSGTELQRL